MMLLLLFTVGCTKNINIDNIQNINYKNNIPEVTLDEIYQYISKEYT